jgi:hypothetical protein
MPVETGAEKMLLIKEIFDGGTPNWLPPAALKAF